MLLCQTPTQLIANRYTKQYSKSVMVWLSCSSLCWCFGRKSYPNSTRVSLGHRLCQWQSLTFFSLCLPFFMMSRFFGLIILPISSYAADALLAIWLFIHTILRYFKLKKSLPSAELSKARDIDVSIQFNLFWLPLIILLGWWTDRRMTLLFGEYLDWVTWTIRCLITIS